MIKRASMMTSQFKNAYIPSSSNYATIIACFILVMCIAFAWQAINAVNQYANLRSNGEVVVGRWTSVYLAPMTEEEVTSYAFEIDGKTYRGSQPNPFDTQLIEQGGDVDIVYDVDNPKSSRIAGTENYQAQNIVELIMSVLIGVMSIQFLFAYHFKRPAWIFIIKDHIQHIIQV